MAFISTKWGKNAWKPKRHGNFYCSPACGGECTWAAYQKAVKDSKALAKKLGKGWKPRVWENLGWHWEVTKGLLTVGWHCGEYSANCNHHFWNSGKTPQLAIQKVRDEIQCRISELQDALSAID